MRCESLFEKGGTTEGVHMVEFILEHTENYDGSPDLDTFKKYHVPVGVTHKCADEGIGIAKLVGAKKVKPKASVEDIEL